MLVSWQFPKHSNPTNSCYCFPLYISFLFMFIFCLNHLKFISKFGKCWLSRPYNPILDRRISVLRPPSPFQDFQIFFFDISHFLWFFLSLFFYFNFLGIFSELLDAFEFSIFFGILDFLAFLNFFLNF